MALMDRRRLIHTAPRNEEATRTPKACYARTSPAESTSRQSIQAVAAKSRTASTGDRETLGLRSPGEAYAETVAMTD